MTCLTPVLLLLVTIQQVFVPVVETSSKITITTNKCPSRWTIRNSCSDHKEYLSISCSYWNWPDTFKLYFKVLSRYCSWWTFYTSLEELIDNAQMGTTYKMCKNSCDIHLCLTNDSCDHLECYESFLLTINSRDPLTADIESENSDCNLNGTDFDFDETEITNQIVSEEVKSLLQNKTELKDGVWVGLERAVFGTNVEWKWISGLTTVNLTWKTGFPVDPLNNHCGKIIWDDQAKQIQLFNADCHEKFPFICQAGPV